MVVPERPTDAAAVERRIVSVLFADLVGFTPLSERLDAEDVATIQDAYFATTRDTIERYGGVLEKFIGDAAMAVFGVPRGREDDAERAVRAGLALIGSIEGLGARLGLEPGALNLRVGVNTGEVVHATAGPDAGRVTGDTVNTAARLQSAAEPGTVLIGELTAMTTAEAIESVTVGSLELKGKAEPVPAWRAVGARTHPSREAAMGALHAPLLGRAAELARLRDALSDVARDRTARRLVIVAPPGVGKSRLLAKLETEAVGGATMIVRARVRPQATAPYETVAQLFGPGGIDSERLGAALAAFGVAQERADIVVAEVARLLDSGSDRGVSAGDLAAERDVRFAAWMLALDALAAGPAVWLVEDVHWAGGDLLAFLDHAGGAESRHGRLVVATTRPSLLERDPGWCATDRLDLAPLAATDSAALVDALLGVGVLPRGLVAAIVDRSDGTPLFIEELLRTWVSVGMLVSADDGGWRLAVEPDAVPMPRTVQAIYAAQLDDLPTDARAVARRGAVAGRRIPADALDSLDLADHRSGIEGLRRRALVGAPTPDPVTGEGYAYRHALLRDAGYASLARAERGRLHLAMGEWLERIAGERVGTVAEAIAEHLAAALENRSALATDGGAAGLESRAATWYERAAESALGVSAHQAAERLLARSVELTIDAPIDLARRRLRRGEILAASANLDAGIVELEAALAGAAQDGPLRSRAATALARALMQQIRFAEAEAVTVAALGELAGQPAAVLAPLHALHAWTVSAQGRADGVLDEANRAVALAADAGDPQVELEVLEHVAAARDEVDAGTDADWARLELVARRQGAWPQVVTALRVRAMYEGMDAPTAALPRLLEAATTARTHGLVEAAGWSEYAQVETLWLLGRWDEALALGREVIAVAERSAYERLALRTYFVLLPMAAVRRDPTIGAAYRRWFATAGSHLPSAPSPYARVCHAAVDAWIQAGQGSPVEPAPDDVVDALIPMVNPHFLAAAETVIGTWLAAGRDDLVAAGAEKLATYAAAPDATRLQRSSSALVDAWLADLRGDRAVAAVAGDRAASLAAEIDAPWWRARALRAAGDVGSAAAIEAALEIG